MLVLLLSFSSTAFGFVFEGPFAVKNQFPVFLPLNQPYLEPAHTEDSFSLGISHSSVFVMKDSANWTAHLDMELTELDLRFKKDLPGLFEAALDVPVVRATAGFLDRPLAWYHRAFGFPNYGRSKRPRNEFLYEVRKDGLPLIEGDNDRTGFGDVRVSLKKKIIEHDGLVASLLGDVEFPTGNAKIGYGNGSLDTGVGMLLDYDLSSTVRLYANLGAVFPGDLKAYQTVDLDPFVYAGSGAEYGILPDLGLLAQIMVQTSPYPGTSISAIDTPGVVLVFGGRYYAGPGGFELSLTEDLNISGAPDFVVNVAYKKRL